MREVRAVERCGLYLLGQNLVTLFITLTVGGKRGLF